MYPFVFGLFSPMLRFVRFSHVTVYSCGSFTLIAVFS